MIPGSGRLGNRLVQILIVDRDPLDVGALLGALPANVETVVTGAVTEALRIADRAAFDLVVVGVPTARSADLDVLEDVRVAFPGVPVLALIGSDDEGLGELALARGALECQVRAVVTAPVLASVIGRLLAASDARSEFAARAEHVESVLAAIEEGIVVQSPSGRVVLATDRALEMLQVPREELISSDLSGVGIEVRSAAGRVLDPEELPDAIARRSGGSVPPMLLQVRRRDGELRWFEARTSPLVRSGDDELYAVVTSLRDITESHGAREALGVTERRERVLLDLIGDGYLLLDAHGFIRESSESVERLWHRDSLGARPLWDLIIEDDRAEFGSVFDDVVANPSSSLRAEARALDRQGSIRWIEFTIANSLDDPSFLSIVANVRDVTDRKRAEDTVMRLSAIIDSYDGAVYSETVDGVITSWNAAAEHLYGYSAREAIGSSALIVTPAERLGGVLVARERILKRKRVALERTLRRRKDGTDVEVSLLVVPLFDASGNLIGSATTATQPARAAEHSIDADSSALRLALERGEMRVHYQPILTVGSAELVGVEALVRWQHPSRGLLAPDEFIPVAERSELISSIGSFVLETALRQVMRWRKELPGCERLWVSVNFSSRQLLLSNPVTACLWALASTGAPADALRLEITETAVMEEVETSIARLTDLRSIGVKVAIDDYGTGPSSLSYLSRLPVGSLKVDQSFIDSIDSESSVAIVDTIVNLARALKLELCAEGVERPDQRVALHQLGCDFGQGFLWSKPLAPDNFEKWLAALQAARST